MYCYLLQCTDYSDTCAVAACDDEIHAWVSGYRQPSAPTALFIWQVAVDREARGKGLARRLILSLLARNSNSDIEHIKATVTADNTASLALFESLAQALDATISVTPHFDRKTHFGGRHASEQLISIGPFTLSQAQLKEQFQ